VRVLGIGIATLDIVNLVAVYPPEDSEVRALGQRLSRGGNATNTLAVLSQLGHRCAWGGVIADEPDSRHILDDLRARGIDTGPCVHHTGGKAPTSYIFLSRDSGTRTIVHYRDLPEFSSTDFARIDLDPWDWVHFEGREPVQVRAMLERLRRLRPELSCSLEVEKPRPGIEALLDLPDLLLFSRAYAEARGYPDAPALLHALRPQCPRALLVCAWGMLGAAVMDRHGSLWESPAFVPPQVMDTLGAGDVFNAGFIDGLLRGGAPRQALDQACRLAGRKCGQFGLEGLGGQFGS
jgi:ketohexokinase